MPCVPTHYYRYLHGIRCFTSPLNCVSSKERKEGGQERVRGVKVSFHGMLINSVLLKKRNLLSPLTELKGEVKSDVNEHI